MSKPGEIADDLQPVLTEGTVDVTGTLALEDALELEQAVKDGAQSLGELGCEESLDVRRSMAVGEMARNQLAFNLNNNGEDGDLTAGGGGRGVNLYAHLDPDGMHASLDNVGGNDVLIQQIKAWCEAVGNVVIIRPVIDLNTQLATNTYTPTDTIVEQIRLRDQVCVFPNCNRRARFCDLDHVIPHAEGGPTCSGNLALLCRKHHRAKTFSAWTYETPQPGVYDWTSPSGLRFQVTRGRRHGRMPITTLIDTEPEP
ncbi:hypothetical protein BH09ACT12_BH09ACT12_37020 [soil metagenome]